MKRVFLPFLCFLLSTVCVAQNLRIVKGFVQDKNQVGIVGATITSPGEDATAVTGQGGAFEIRVSPYARYVEAACDGYFSEKAEIDGSMIVLRLKADKNYVKSNTKAESAAQSEEAARLDFEKAVEEANERKLQRLVNEDSIRKVQEEADRIAFEKAVSEAREARQQRLDREEAERLAQEEAARKAAEKKQKRLEEKEAKRLAKEEAERIEFEKAVQEARERRQQRLEMEANQ